MDLIDGRIEDMTPKQAQALINTLETRNEELTGILSDELREAGEFGRTQLAVEDIGWRPLAGFAEGGANSFTLTGLHRISELCRAVATINPLVKRGLQVRTGYIWGAGVEVVAREFRSGPGRPRTRNTTPTLPKGLDGVLTGTLAQIEIEKSIATDGNVQFLVDPGSKRVQRVPWEEVTDGVSERGNRENLLFIQRTWNDWDLELEAGQGVQERPFTDPGQSQGRRWALEQHRPEAGDPGPYRVAWYPTPAAMQAKSLRSLKEIGGVPVDHSQVMVHVALNRLTGWRWGVPDVLPAIWWTKAYKEYLENCATLAKAYARFAWKVTNDKSRSVRRTAATLAQAPRVDPATGQPMGVGGSAVMGAGQDLSAIGGKGNVDFDAGRPLAAMVAAALDVPLPALTEDPSIGNRSSSASLDDSTKLVMKARQRVMDHVYQQVFDLLGLKVRLRWPEIAEDPIHRKLQAIDMAIRLGLISDKEARAMILDAWNDKWLDFSDKPPTLEELPIMIRNAVMTRNAGPGAPGPLKAGSDPGGRPPRQPEPISFGDHELRDE